MAKEGVKAGLSSADVAALIAAEATARDTAIGVETTARGVAIATHAALFGLHSKIILKTATESIISSETLTNDTHLKLSVLANEVWEFLLYLRFTGQVGVGEQAKMLFTIPSSASLTRLPQASTSSGGEDATTSKLLTLVDTPTVRHHFCAFIYIGGGTAGTVQLQWAQNVSEAKYHYFLVNSYIIAHQLA